MLDRGQEELHAATSYDKQFYSIAIPERLIAASGEDPADKISSANDVEFKALSFVRTYRKIAASRGSPLVTRHMNFTHAP